MITTETLDKTYAELPKDYKCRQQQEDRGQQNCKRNLVLLARGPGKGAAGGCPYGGKPPLFFPQTCLKGSPSWETAWQEHRQWKRPEKPRLSGQSGLKSGGAGAGGQVWLFCSLSSPATLPWGHPKLHRTVPWQHRQLQLLEKPHPSGQRTR